MVPALVLFWAASCPAQTTLPASDQELITLNFPENMELKTLVDYVSQRLGFNVSYQDEQLSNQRVTIRAPSQVPATALLGLLQSMLKTRGLTIIDADQPGWKRIVPLAVSAVPTTQPSAGGPNEPVAQAFFLQNADAQRVDTIIKPFLSGSSAASFDIAEQHTLIVVDFASNMPRVAEIIRLLDRPDQGSKIAFVPAHNADLGQLAQQVRQILAAKARAQAVNGQEIAPIEVTPDARTGQLVVVGAPALVDEAASVTASLDVPVTEQQSPVRFYKLANATAADVLDTLRSLEGDDSTSQTPPPPAAGPPATAQNPTATPSIATPQQSPPETSGVNPNVMPSLLGHTDLSGTVAAAVAAPSAIHSRRATVAADTNTNTLIVIAEPAVQKLYEQLIRTLDKRRPQVLIEATIVTLDTTDGFQLGVELSGHSHPGGKNDVVTFSNFGLSTPNATTGQLSLIPGLGFNGALVSTDLADVILRALASNSRTKISSAPRILVNDNATGTLQSLSEQPYTSTNIGTSLSTTSFAGYAEAGTEITLTPHISEADYLQLEYTVALSSFTDTTETSQGIPPPRQTDSVESKVTIPDGSTVIVGGLNRTNYTHTVDAIPVLGEIPYLGTLFSNKSTTSENLTLFVFLRPVILRDDQFEDLKYISFRDVTTSGVSDGWPVSSPAPIH
ncbi:MAG: secretin N-terminal domain-containing protein [Tepidisphaeraceae bacterium]